MRRYLKYFSYVCRHKFYVTRECWRRGLIWQGLAHDLDKFRWRMFVDYARFFHYPNGNPKGYTKPEGYYKPAETDDPRFDLAWFGHTRRARHHWQYWVLQADQEKTRCFPMPGKYILEMYCDWLGANKAQHAMRPVSSWWQANEEKMLLHPETRWILQAMIGGSDAGLPVKGMKQMRRRLQQAREWAERQPRDRPEDPLQKEFRETHNTEGTPSISRKSNKPDAYKRL